MAVLAAHGVELDLPTGWEGRIRRRESLQPHQPVTAAVPSTSGGPPVVVHAASIPLTAGDGDFGGGAVERMTRADVFVALVEFDAESASTALFRRHGMPRSVRPDAFDRSALQRALPGQGGLQSFFVESGRPFCLYVVLGSYVRRSRTVPIVNGVLSGVRIT